MTKQYLSGILLLINVTFGYCLANPPDSSADSSYLSFNEELKYQYDMSIEGYKVYKYISLGEAAVCIGLTSYYYHSYIKSNKLDDLQGGNFGVGISLFCLAQFCYVQYQQNKYEKFIITLKNTNDYLLKESLAQKALQKYYLKASIVCYSFSAITATVPPLLFYGACTKQSGWAYAIMGLFSLKYPIDSFKFGKKNYHKYLRVKEGNHLFKYQKE